MEEADLSELHNIVANELIDRIKNGAASSADLSVARQFLRDNGIDANTGQSEPLMNLATVLPFAPEAEVG